MKRTTHPLRAVRAVAFLTLTTGFLGVGTAGTAEEIQHLSITQPGGMPGLPVMGPIQQVSNGVSVTWFGPAGYYQLLEKTSMTTSTWRAVGGLRLTNQAILSSNHASSFFQVLGPTSSYAGSRACLDCHPGPHAAVMNTAHAGAFTNRSFAMQGGQTDPSCLACHTVGYGLPTGFAVTNRNGIVTYSTHLAGVQCENCHGPAARHAANPSDFTVRARLEIAATMCGGCHTAESVPSRVASSHLPFYEDWNASAHRVVNDSVRANFSGSNSSNSISNCGRCHSGTVREALLENAPLPGGHEAGAIGVVCASCHDPHENYLHTNVLAGVLSFTNELTGFSYIFTNSALGVRYTNQLREPLASLRDYRTSGDFATNYDATINGCAQCHNDRAASYRATKSPPHSSLQYNMLLGTVGEMTNGVPPQFPAAHSRIEKQCASCHMQTPPAESGHKFTLTSYEACASCHGTASNAQGLADLLKSINTSLGQDVKDGLDQWGTTKAPIPIRPYGALAWEYENAGQLSSPDGTGHGPTMDEQQYIPDNIKKARFNLYLVFNDGSFGAHNGPLAISLLQAAQSWVTTELNQ
ncbi:MAG TPA: multiheme c-type cytochrome [Verrucomicrobiae bacterium]|nr:multiheme c-type cytochrome [Verrucomicrobiae bacterium]